MSRELAETIFAKVSERVTPSKLEAAVEKRFARKLAERIEEAFGDPVRVRFVGSTARDTGLKNDRDIDLFVAFPQGRKLEAMVKSLGTVLQEKIKAKWEMHYAEHPYFQAQVGNYQVEVIPCYAISKNERIISAVDRTPLHATYLQEKLSEQQRRDVRVLKKLLKAQGLYGAESEVQGFSGLVCEYLVLNYRDLYSLLEHVSQWKPPVLLDMENAYEGNAQKMREKFASPLVLVDFIDSERNAAAAVGGDRLAQFIALSRRFLQRPSLEWFFPKLQRVSFSELQKAFKARLHFLLVEFPRPSLLVNDIFVPQLRRTERSLAKHLELEEFKVHDSCSFYSPTRCHILLELEHASAPRLRKVFGPPVAFADDVQRFLSSHPEPVRGPFVENGKVVVEEKRPYHSSVGLLHRIRQDPALFAVASHLVKGFAEARVLEKDNVLKEAKRNKALRNGLKNYLFRKDAYL